MRLLLKSNNPVELNFAEAILNDAGIANFLFDEHMSVMDGSLGVLPRRLMVADEDFTRAEALLDAGLKEAPAEL